MQISHESSKKSSNLSDLLPITALIRTVHVSEKPKPKYNVNANHF